MIDPKAWEESEEAIIRMEPQNLKRNFALMDAFYREAVKAGVFPSADPLEGLDVDIRIAQVVNHVRPAA
jgi:hypothetical protein